jgi:hypothetical protein
MVRRRWVFLAFAAPAFAAPAFVAAVVLVEGVEDRTVTVIAVALAASAPVLGWAGLRSRATVTSDGVLEVRSFLRREPPLRLDQVRGIDRRMPYERIAGPEVLGGLLLVTGSRVLRLPLGWWRDEQRLLAEIRRFLSGTLEIVDEVDTRGEDLTAAVSEALRRRRQPDHLEDGEGAGGSTPASGGREGRTVLLTPMARHALGLSLSPQQERFVRSARRRGAIPLVVSTAVVLFVGLMAYAWIAG